MPLFHVCTDHRSLVHVFEKNIADVENPRLRSYREKLQEYSFKVSYLKGEQNLIADMLSRNPVWPAEQDDSNDKELCQTLNTMETTRDPVLKPLLQAAETDEDYQSLLKALESEVKFEPFKDHPFIKEFHDLWDDLSIQAWASCLSQRKDPGARQLRQQVARVNAYRSLWRGSDHMARS